MEIILDFNIRKMRKMSWNSVETVDAEAKSAMGGVKKRIANGEKSGTIFDSNGNDIGTWRLEE